MRPGGVYETRGDSHTPPDRPAKWWSVIYDSGKPTPYVPIHEPFELVG
ncbi:DUF5447 family protein [Stutzerimonas stutzeri]